MTCLNRSILSEIFPDTELVTERAIGEDICVDDSLVNSKLEPELILCIEIGDLRMNQRHAQILR